MRLKQQNITKLLYYNLWCLKKPLHTQHVTPSIPNGARCDATCLAQAVHIYVQSSERRHATQITVDHPIRRYAT